MSTIEIPEDIIRERIDQAPIKHGDKWRCPVCPATFDTPQAVGPHKLGHMRAIGLAPPRSKTGQPLKRHRVRCPQCPIRMGYGALRGHLQRVHKLGIIESSEAIVTIAEELQGKVQASTDVVPVEPEPAEEVRRRRPTIEVDDAVVGMLLGLSGGETVKITDIPEVATWVQHTRHIAALVSDDD